MSHNIVFATLNKVYMKKIYISHLHYKIEVNFNSKTYLKNIGREACAIHTPNKIQLLLKNKPKLKDFPTVAHEVMHVIQFISKDRGIDMTNEVEHCGYLMQFILNEILEYKYI